MLLSNLKIFTRQVLILTATVSKMPVLRREKKRTLEKANGRTRQRDETKLVGVWQGLCLLMGKLRLPEGEYCPQDWPARQGQGRNSQALTSRHPDSTFYTLHHTMLNIKKKKK